jgi:hypothetical protein
MIKMASDFKSMYMGQPSDGYLTVWWPWDRSCFLVSWSLLWCTCTDLAFWVIAGGTGIGGYCPWWSFWPSCDIGCCRCPGGQIVCPQWRVGQTTPPSGVPCGCGRCSFRTRRWYSPTGCPQLCICKNCEGFRCQAKFLQPPEVKEALWNLRNEHTPDQA